MAGGALSIPVPAAADAMTTPRLHIDAVLEADAEVQVTPAQAHHLGNVLRRGPGDPVLLFNARDGEWAARIAALRRDQASFVVTERLRAPTPGPDVRLVIAALKRDAIDLVVEKATELGVSSIQPVFTRRCVADRVNTARLAAIATAAAEQSERLTVPQLLEAMPLHAALDRWDASVPLVIGAERCDALPLAAVARDLAPSGFGWLVGPEGGFERAELDDLLRRPFVAPASLGPRILRAETAALAGLAVLQAIAGDWAVG
jgi:16S rRNA (uracil1498-N3)-methyltransferase